MAELQKGSKKLLNAWAFYDWANSVYALVITSAIFPIFYNSLFKDDNYIDAFGFHLKSTALINYVTAFTFLVVAFISPVLSGIADYTGNKKVFMKFFCYMGSIGCIGLYWFSIEHVYISLLFYVFGLLGFWASLVFYNSYLPDIAFKDQQDGVSAKGFSLGYAGSVLLLLINLGMVMKPEWFGFWDGLGGELAKDAAVDKATRSSFITVGLWWIIFSQYSYYYLPKGVSKGHKVTKDVIFKGIHEFKIVWKGLSENLRLKRYLSAFFVYSMAVQTIMLVATYFGEEEINWGGDSKKIIGLIGSILIIQIIAIFGALLTSWASHKFGNIKILIVINFIWMGICFYGYFIETPIQFYITAAFVGLVMGGIQSLSRSTYSRFLPQTDDTTSYFSFFDVAEKIGIVIGMAIYATIDQITGSMRNSILFLFIFFLIGIILLFRVPKTKTID